MKYFFDTEFLEDGETIKLISIGIVAEDGREFYRESSDISADEFSPWLNENVKPHLKWANGDTSALASRPQIALDIEQFLKGDGSPEFWAYCASYDWVVLMWLWGPMIVKPRKLKFFPMDIAQVMAMMPEWDGELPKQEGAEHHALADARWVRDAYYCLLEAD